MRDGLRRLGAAGCLAIGVSLAGCGANLQYQGMSPSARTFHDDPGMGDVYVGADAQFIVTDRAQQRQLAAGPSASLARQDTIDAWNGPVAWDQVMASAPAPIEQAQTDPAPATPD